jgi:methionine-rich copper-binding protein CopC
MSTRLRTIAIAVAATALFTLGSTAASAHSGLESSTPADGSVITQAPASIAFTFDEELLADADSISLNAADGTNIASAKVQPTGNTVELPWPSDLAPGSYQAAYRVVSADGHPVTGAISFTYAPAAASSSAASAPASATTSGAPSASAVPISNTAEPER